MRRALVCGLLLVAASCGPKPPACDAGARDALRALYDRAAKDVIDSGACDKYERVEQCPAYLVVEGNFTVTEATLCQPKP